MTSPLMVASWRSRGGKWTAWLQVSEAGYTIEEFKNGASVGRAFRPRTMLADNEAAIAWAMSHVRNCFDVAMIRDIPTTRKGI